MEAQPLVVQTRVTTSIVRLVESILMLISASEEHYSEKMLRYYKSELYELLCFVRLCSTQKRNLYVSLGRGNKSKKAHAEWKKEIQIKLEEDGFFDEAGKFRYIDGRQTDLIIIPKSM